MTTIIIGLGNPGEQYKNTRHNVGFMTLDKFAEENNFPNFDLQKKSNALVSKKENTILAKPQTFMNESGKAVKEIIKNKEIKDIIVIHDDIDLPIGKIKIVQERGSAGHKGVESIINNIGNEGLIRIRVGIGGQKDTEAINIVLKKFSPEEQKIIDESIQKASHAINVLIKDGLEKTMNEFNK